MDTTLGRVVDALPGWVWAARPEVQIDFLGDCWSDYTGLSVADGQPAGTA